MSVYESLSSREFIYDSYFRSKLATSVPAGTFIYGSEALSRLPVVSKATSVDLRSSSRELETSSTYSTCVRSHVSTTSRHGLSAVSTPERVCYPQPNFRYMDMVHTVLAPFPELDFEVVLQYDILLWGSAPVLSRNCLKSISKAAHKASVEGYEGNHPLDYLETYKWNFMAEVVYEVLAVFQMTDERLPRSLEEVEIYSAMSQSVEHFTERLRADKPSTKHPDPTQPSLPQKRRDILNGNHISVTPREVIQPHPRAGQALSEESDSFRDR